MACRGLIADRRLRIMGMGVRSRRMRDVLSDVKAE